MSRKNFISNLIKSFDNGDNKETISNPVQGKIINFDHLNKKDLESFEVNLKNWYDNKNIELKLIKIKEFIDSDKENILGYNLNNIINSCLNDKKKNKTLPPEYHYAIVNACEKLKMEKNKLYPNYEPYTTYEELLNEIVKFILINMFNQLNRILTDSSI